MPRAFPVYLLALLTGPVSALAGEPAGYLLTVEGNAAARVELRCTLTRADGPADIRLTGPLPIRERLTGTALRCTVRQTAAHGRIAVRIESSRGNLTRTSLSGGNSVMRLAID